MRSARIARAAAWMREKSEMALTRRQLKWRKKEEAHLCLLLCLSSSGLGFTEPSSLSLDRLLGCVAACLSIYHQIETTIRAYPELFPLHQPRRPLKSRRMQLLADPKPSFARVGQKPVGR